MWQAPGGKPQVVNARWLELGFASRNPLNTYTLALLCLERSAPLFAANTTPLPRSPAAAALLADAHPGHLPIRVHTEVKESGQLEEAVGPLLVGVLQGMLNNSTAEGPTQ